MKKIKFFADCQTAEELKKAFHKLAMKFHPDNGGDGEAFKAMKAEFEMLFDLLKNVHRRKDGETWEATGEKATTETAAEFMDIIEKVMFIDNLTVELCGSWVWVGGETKKYKDYLKENGFKYSANKKMWYYQRDGVRKWHKKAWSITEIRDTYGSEVYKGSRKVLDVEKETA